jgi:CMP-N,N'-diacetyllegionaminic acid synthase
MSGQLRVLGIIPARGGSKRVPRKNLRILDGKPLVAHSIEAARAATRLARLVVSSDDEEVLAIARNYDPLYPVRRPAELATDAALAIEFVRHALQTLENAGEPAFHAVAIVQPSSPLTLTSDIDGTIELLENSGADSAVSVVEVDHAIHPMKIKSMEGDRLVAYFQEEKNRMAAHQLPKLFVRNCSVYAIRRATIESGEIIGDDSRGYVMPRERSIDINDELDWEFLQFLASKCRKTMPGSTPD